MTHILHKRTQSQKDTEVFSKETFHKSEVSTSKRRVTRGHGQRSFQKRRVTSMSQEDRV